MRLSPAYLLAALVLFLTSTLGQSVPPGAPMPHTSDVPVVWAPNAPIQGVSPRPRADPIELQREAGEVLELSKSIQLDFDSVSQGLLPKDTIENLKKIEKLSKRLRSQLER